MRVLVFRKEDYKADGERMKTDIISKYGDEFYRKFDMYPFEDDGTYTVEFAEYLNERGISE